jgi:hypothetical protein
MPAVGMVDVGNMTAVLVTETGWTVTALLVYVNSVLDMLIPLWVIWMDP